METLLARPPDTVHSLQKLLPFCREGIGALHHLALRFSLEGWKDLFHYLRDQQMRCMEELERKIRECGGVVDPDESESAPEPAADPEDEPCDPLALDRAMLLKCLNQQAHLAQRYLDARKHIFPFDVRMTLYRHHLQIREALMRLSALYEEYPARSTQELHVA